jgi:hypothetical protein
LYEYRNNLLTILGPRTIISELSWISTFVFLIVLSFLWDVALLIILITLLIVFIAIIAVSNTWTCWLINFIVIIRRTLILWSWPFG